MRQTTCYNTECPNFEKCTVNIWNESYKTRPCKQFNTDYLSMRQSITRIPAGERSALLPERWQRWGSLSVGSAALTASVKATCTKSEKGSQAEIYQQA